jgi:three-Cys-motif partner protein
MRPRAIDLWRELCEPLEIDDGLRNWEQAGHWTRDKLYFWKRYIDITTAAMHGHRAFPGGLVYVDLFAGAGVCTLRDSGERIPGSAIIAVSAQKPFARILVCEKDPELAEACRTRLARTLVAQRCHVFTGDCNCLIGQIVEKIPDDSLTLAFIDPKGLDAKFETIATLSRDRRVDFVVLFADAYDINRNAHYYYWDNSNSKLDQVLGPDSDWRAQIDNLANQSSVNLRKKFADIYKDQLRRHLGYSAFHEKVICDGGMPLYRLIYASRHSLGLKFWEEAVGQDSAGQRELF